MKKLLLLLMFIPLISFGQDSQNLILGLNTGMTKKEAIKEFKSNKDKYKKITLGSYYWRHYYQNNSYDSNGKLSMVRLIPVGSGMTGLAVPQAKLVFKDLVRLLVAQGYKNDDIDTKSGDNYLQFAVGETYMLTSKEKGKNIYIGTPVFGSGVNFNIVIGKYEDVKEIDYSDSAL
jgi:hypothetical protein|tara:strand:+ start:31 stop:555 length:525 start_codon:yes stop_codon:yes gene_type:complete